ncbi:MAG: acyl-CoA dehydrogenase family protein [Desulfobacterales bacterium]|nr:acyl-CoA dehydrogenase family protein [Desulfobacterales bacterium]
MDILLTEEDKKFQHHCKIFSREKLLPLAEKYGETADVPGELVRAMADAELFKILIPKELGGSGVNALKICLAREQLAGVYCPADVTLAMQGLGSYPIVLAGNEHQKRRYLSAIGRGELLTTYALTEPEAGSDVNGMVSMAEKNETGFILNGKKRFISNGHAAQIMVAFARTPTEENSRAMSAFVLEKGMEGLKVSRRLDVIAPHDLVELEFERCIVPSENLLGSAGDGYGIAMKTLDVFRMSVGAAAVGIGQAAFDEALRYARVRKQFGSSIGKFQSVQLKIADMATELDASRALVYRAAITKDCGVEDVSRFASMAKFYATEAAFRTVDQALQIHGGIGVIKGSKVERLYREIRALRIYEGTTDIQKLIVANSLMKQVDN